MRSAVIEQAVSVGIDRPSGRERIMRSATGLFLARGFADVSMQEVADAVGMTKAALYYHFSDKEDLFAEVAGAELERIFRGIAERLSLEASFRDQLEGIARFLLETGGGNLGRLLNDLDHAIDSERAETVRERARTPHGAVLSAFEAAVERGEVRPVDLTIAISLFYSMIFGQIRRAAKGQAATADPATLAAAIADMTLNGIGAV
ncbi:MAG: TetR/AcrR family transcriptional regulator, partial [Thermomicrobiales bacterium]